MGLASSFAATALLAVSSPDTLASASCPLVLPPAPNNEVDTLVAGYYPSGTGAAGVANNYSWLTVDIVNSSPEVAPTVPNGLYPAWCIDFATGLAVQPYTQFFPYNGQIISSCDPSLNSQIPAHTGVHVDTDAWRQINWIINHRGTIGQPGYLNYGIVQEALWHLVGIPNPSSPHLPGYNQTAVNNLLLAAAAAAPTWTPDCGDKIAAVISYDQNYNALADVQLIIIEVPLVCASIGNFVWEDTNADGVQDLGEPGIPGVTVQLLDCAGNVLDSTTTDANGLYGFTGLIPGDYKVKVLAPGGYLPSPSVAGLASDPTDSDADPVTGEMACTTLVPGENDDTWDAGFYRLASIGNFVWEDTNANGQQDLGEPGIPGVTVQLLDCAGNLLDSTTTDANGLYGFSGLMPGDYKIKVLAPAGYVASPSVADTASDPTDSDADPVTGEMACTTLIGGENDDTWDAGFYKLASIGNFVWEDYNANGQQDLGEPGIPGVTVQLLDCDGNVLDSTVTDANGLYGFSGLFPSDYKIKVLAPAGYLPSPSVVSLASDPTDSDADPVTGEMACTTLVPGENDDTWDAGFYRLASIGNFVWEDTNANGQQDLGEPGIPGVTVQLLDCAGNVLDSTVTDANGLYGFSGLFPGDYKIKVLAPAGYVASPSVAGGASDPTDSDADPVTGEMACTTLVPGENDDTWDAGFFKLASIGNFVWEDNNANGQQDLGEPGIPGVTVQLLDCAGNVLNSTVTDANGLYSFTGLMPGDYKIKVLAPAGYTASPSVAGGASDPTDSDANPATGEMACTTLTPGENDDTWDAGFYKPASIGNFVWHDKNANGQQELGEPGIPGVTVQLLDCAGNVLNSTVTDANGLYSFTGLMPGDYKIKVLAPAGYTASPSVAGGASDPTDSDANPATGEMACTTLVAGENDDTWDAGFYKPASIGDFVWKDTNANGQQELGEPGVGGVTVRLLDCAGNILASTTTDSNGLYAFTGLKPGDYNIQVVLPAGYVFTTQDQGANASDSDANTGTGAMICTTLESGEHDPTWDAGLVEPEEPCVEGPFSLTGGSNSGTGAGNVRTFSASGVSVKATAFSRTSDGSWATAYLGQYSGGLGVTDSGEGDGSGNKHTVDNVDRNNYILFEFSEEVIVTSATLGYVVEDSDITVWVGNIPNAYNNHQTLSDALLTGLTLKEDDDTDLTGTRTADFNAGQVSGNILVVSASTSDTTPNDWFKLKILGICLPEVPLASIGDKVWDDLDADGVQDAGEPGVNGVKVDLYKCDNTFVATTTTAGGGLYNFTVPPGDYYVKFSGLPAGYVFSPSTPSSASDASDSDANPATGVTACTTLVDGENDPTWDAGINKPAAPCIESTVSLTGGSNYGSGAGNIRTFSVNGVSVKASAFSRTTGGTWAAGYLGQYSGGLGVTDSGEGDGSSNKHTVDNVDRNNYILFEFSQAVTVDSAYLGYVVEDSDVTVWIGTIANAFNNHQTLSDALLTGLGYKEDNDTTLTGARTADFNSGERSGNILVIAASTSDTTPNDWFKIKSLDICPNGTTPAPEPPACPTQVLATAGNCAVSLTWNAVPGATSYTIKRATSAGGSYTTVKSGLTSTSWTDTSVSNGTTYYYLVLAVNGAGTSPGCTPVPSTPTLPAPVCPTGVLATAGNCAVSLTWNAVPGATSYKVKRATSAGGSYTTVKSGLTSTSWTDTSVSNDTTYYYLVVAVTAGGESSGCTPVPSTPAGTLPSPWGKKDIGAVAKTGGASYDGIKKQFTLNGSGEDIWGVCDEFRYVYQAASGDCSIVARVTSVGNTHEWAKAGVMIRETLNTGSEHASVFVTPSNGVAFQYRSSTGGSSDNINTTGLSAPYWVKIVRSGNTFTASRSATGADGSWTIIGSKTIYMGSSVYIGLAVTAHNDGALSTATFENVTANP